MIIIIIITIIIIIIIIRYSGDPLDRNGIDDNTSRSCALVHYTLPKP